MTLIQQFMPRWRLRQVEHVAVLADPARAYAAARSIDLYRVAVARQLFALRLLPERIAAWLKRKDLPPPRSATIDQITAPGNGFHLLADGEREVVVGAIGKFWHPSIEFAPVTAETFASHDDRGWGKVAWGIAVSPREDGGSWITLDLRVDAGDDASWTAFQRYWRLIGPFSHAMRRGLMRILAHDLGPISDDLRHVAGDEQLDDVRAQLTHAIDIEAPVARVWPWILQLGCQRGGWYSYDLLDNGGVPSADHIDETLQDLAVGDIIPARPVGTVGFEVLEVQEERALVLRGASPDFDGTWSFALEPIGTDATHLVTRYSASYAPSVRMSLLGSVMTPVHALMTHKQLRTIKQRAESDQNQRRTSTTGGAAGPESSGVATP